MNLRIGDYLDRKIKEKEISKKELYDELKKNFHDGEEYVKYKGFTSKFYRKLYAEDLIEISYILGIDLNEMRDTIIHKNKFNSITKVDDALKSSKYINLLDDKYAKWSFVEEGKVYIIWFKAIEVDLLDVKIEMYDIKKNEIFDISYLTYLAISKMDNNWENKDFEEKMHSIKNLNKMFYDRNMS